MFAKIVIFCAAVAAAHASLVGPYGLGLAAPLAAVGPYGYGRGLIGAPAVAVGAIQSAAINHAAPVGIRTVGPLGYGPAGIVAANGLVGGHGLGLGGGLLGAPYGLGLGNVGVAAPGVLGLGLGKAIL